MNITINILRSVYNQKNITADKVFKVAYILNIRVDEFLFRKKFPLSCGNFLTFSREEI